MAKEDMIYFSDVIMTRCPVSATFRYHYTDGFWDTNADEKLESFLEKSVSTVWAQDLYYRDQSLAPLIMKAFRQWRYNNHWLRNHGIDIALDFVAGAGVEFCFTARA